MRSVSQQRHRSASYRQATGYSTNCLHSMLRKGSNMAEGNRTFFYERNRSLNNFPTTESWIQRESPLQSWRSHTSSPSVEATSDVSNLTGLPRHSTPQLKSFQATGIQSAHRNTHPLPSKSTVADTQNSTELTKTGSLKHKNFSEVSPSVRQPLQVMNYTTRLQRYDTRSSKLYLQSLYFNVPVVDYLFQSSCCSLPNLRLMLQTNSKFLLQSTQFKALLQTIYFEAPVIVYLLQSSSFRMCTSKFLFQSTQFKVPVVDYILKSSCFSLPSSNFQLQTIYLKVPVVVYLAQSSSCRLSTSKFMFQSTQLKVPVVDYLLQSSCFSLRSSKFQLYTIYFKVPVLVYLAQSSSCRLLTSKFLFQSIQFKVPIEDYLLQISCFSLPSSKLQFWLSTSKFLLWSTQSRVVVRACLISDPATDCRYSGLLGVLMTPQTGWSYE